jgi:hypothetical protein
MAARAVRMYSERLMVLGSGGLGGPPSLGLLLLLLLLVLSILVFALMESYISLKKNV